MKTEHLSNFHRTCLRLGARLYGALRGESLDAEDKMQPRKIRNFNTPLVEHCNLKCRGCDHFAPLAKPGFADLTTFEKDFVRLSELLDGDVDRIGLMGGEPLLHPRIADFLPIARKCFPKTRIRIVTNGVRLLKQKENFWRACAESDIVIEVTKYPIRLNFEQMRNVCVSHGVTFAFREDTGEVEKTSYHIPLDLEGRQDIRKNFSKCFHANYAISLREGKLYTCTAVPNIRHFNEYFHLNLPVTRQDSINIHQAKNAREIFEFLCQPIPFCRFCLVEKRTFGHPWQRSEKNIKEWTV